MPNYPELIHLRLVYGFIKRRVFSYRIHIFNIVLRMAILNQHPESCAERLCFIEHLMCASASLLLFKVDPPALKMFYLCPVSSMDGMREGFGVGRKGSMGMWIFAV